MLKYPVLTAILGLALTASADAHDNSHGLNYDQNDRYRIERQIDRLERDIHKAHNQDQISWDEQRWLRERIRDVDRMFDDYQWGGLSDDEYWTLTTHLRHIDRDLYQHSRKRDHVWGCAPCRDRPGTFWYDRLYR